MLFKPHPIQVQALRIAKRFQLGFRPIKVVGEPLAEASILAKIKFDSVPAFVLSAEIGHSTEYGGLIEELCQRGYLAKHDAYPKCPYFPLEYVTEGGTKVHVHDEDWQQIDVLPRDAKSLRRHVGGFSGVVHFGGVATPSRRRRKPKIVGKGSCYELTAKGFDLVDQVEAGNVIDPQKHSALVEGALLSETYEGFASADVIWHDHGIKQARLSEAKRDGRVKSKPAPPGQVDSQGRKVRVLYNVADALKQCRPKHVKERTQHQALRKS